MTPAPTLQELIESVKADAPADTPLEQLTQASRTVGDLEEVSDALLGHFVDRCRHGGHSWSEISAALGVSKQAAHKRFSPGAPTFERFTLRARAALNGAANEARRLGDQFVGPEHLLLALVDAPESLAGILLAQSGCTRSRVHEQITAHPAGGAGGVTGAGVEGGTRSGGGTGARAGAGAGVRAETPAGDGAGTEGTAGAGDGTGTGGTAGAGDGTGTEGTAGAGDGAGPGNNVPYSPDAIETLRRAVVEALDLGHNYIGTEHLLLALLRDPNTNATATALATLGVTYAQIRSGVIDFIAGFSKP